MSDDAEMLRQAGWTSRVVAGVTWWRMPCVRWVRWFSEREAARIQRVRASREVS